MFGVVKRGKMELYGLSILQGDNRMCISRRILFLAVFVLIIMSSGCVSEPVSSLPGNDKVEVDLALASYDPEVPGWSAVIEAANKKLAPQNIEIKINKIPTSTWEPYYQKILTLIASGNAPDIGRIAESYLPILIEKNQIVEVTDKMGQIDKEQYLDGAFSGAAFVDGRVYGLPCGIYTMLLYYNRDLFDEAGVEYPSSDWNNPVTWDEFRSVAAKLTKGDGSDKIFGAHLNLEILMLNQYFMGNGGAPLFDEKGACMLNHPKNAEILDLFGKMYTEDKSLMRPIDAKTVGYGDMFRAGKVGMMVEGTWFHYKAKNIKQFEAGIAAIPSNTGRSVCTNFIDSWVIFNGSKHENEAWEALKAIISKEAFDALAPHSVGGIPITKSTIEQYKENIVGEHFDKYGKSAFIESINHTVQASYSVNINYFTRDWNYLLESYSLGGITTGEFIERGMEVISEGNMINN